MTNPPPPRATTVKRGTHTKEFKQKAVVLARRADVGFARAGKDLGINESLLRFGERERRQLLRRRMPAGP